MCHFKKCDACAKEIEMSANRKIRKPLYLVSVLLVVALLSGAAPLNHASPVVLAQFSDDVFAPSTAFEYTNLAVAPTANFSADPTSGPPTLQVQFTDESVGSPTGWAWYFGDEVFAEPWMPMTMGAEWKERYEHTSVTLPDGSIVLMGGYGDSRMNDVWRSTDQGITWTQMTAAAPWTARYRHTSVTLPDGSIVLMGGDDGNRRNDVWRSTDLGATWTQMTAAAEWSGRSEHTSVTLPDGSIVLMGGYTAISRNDVWRSTDLGATWTQMTAAAEWLARGSHSSVVLPDGSIVLMGGRGGTTSLSDVWRSTDLGTTWTQMTAAAPWTGTDNHTSVALPDSSIILMGGYDGNMQYQNDVWRSTDLGATWTQMTTAAEWGERSRHTSGVLSDGSIVLMGGSYGGRRNDVWRSTDLGATWTQMTAAAPWSARSGHTSVVLPDGSIVLMGGPGTYSFRNDVWRSTDNGVTWAQMTAAAAWEGRIDHTSVALPDGSIVLMGGNDGTLDFRNDVWRSTDQGVTWTQMAATAPWTGRDQHTSVALPDGSIVLMGGRNSRLGVRFNDVWRSTDQGATWTQMTAAAEWTARSSQTSVVLPDGSIVLMGGYDGDRQNDVWRSTDLGATWTQMTAAAEWTARSGHTSVVLPDGSIVLIGGYDGDYQNDVWRSTDNGVTWAQMTAAAAWEGRIDHTSVALPDGSIVLMAGDDPRTSYDVWRVETAGSTAQHPTHSYTEPGTYSVALQVYNTDGFSSMRRVAYIRVEGTETHFLYLPLVLRNTP
jgi:N-acetylneuraminic acid mutarotase